MSSTKPLGVCVLALIGVVFRAQWKETRALEICYPKLGTLVFAGMATLSAHNRHKAFCLFHWGFLQKKTVQCICPKNVFLYLNWRFVSKTHVGFMCRNVGLRIGLDCPSTCNVCRNLVHKFSK